MTVVFLHDPEHLLYGMPSGQWIFWGWLINLKYYGGYIILKAVSPSVLRYKLLHVGQNRAAQF